MRMNGLMVTVSSLLLFAILIGMAVVLTSEPAVMPDDSGEHGAKPRLVVHTAAGLKGPMTELAFAYERAYGVVIDLRFGGSGTLMAGIELNPLGDAFLSADIDHLIGARRKGLVQEILNVAKQRPVIAVAAGNPKGINSINDLLQKDIRFGLANPDAAAVGTITKKALEATGQWEAVSKAAAVMKPTVNEVATDLAIGTLDAAIVWDATVSLINRDKKVAEIVIPTGFEPKGGEVGLGILSNSKQPTLALHFARWISSPERGEPVFHKHGFSASGGDVWAERPEIVFYSGSVNRPAVEKALRAFSNREGVAITTKYNGCGILCADMLDLAEKADGDNNVRVPDAYYACDICFIEPVKDLFPEAVIMTETDIVIAVQKGNPKNISSLVDLANPKMRLGVSNAEQATLGFMTKRLLKEAGLLNSIRPNIKVENPQADFLINHLSTGSLDAVIVCKVNVGEHIDEFDLIPIKHPGALAVEPFAKSSTTPYPAIMSRLLNALRTHQKDYEAVGFRWIGNEEAVPSSAFTFKDGPGQE